LKIPYSFLEILRHFNIIEKIKETIDKTKTIEDNKSLTITKEKIPLKIPKRSYFTIPKFSQNIQKKKKKEKNKTKLKRT